MWGRMVRTPSVYLIYLAITHACSILILLSYVFGVSYTKSTEILDLGCKCYITSGRDLKHMFLVCIESSL